MRVAVLDTRVAEILRKRGPLARDLQELFRSMEVAIEEKHPGVFVGIEIDTVSPRFELLQFTFCLEEHGCSADAWCSLMYWIFAACLEWQTVKQYLGEGIAFPVRCCTYKKFGKIVNGRDGE